MTRATRTAELLAAVPPEPDVVELRTAIREAAMWNGHRVVVLDDDPTGVQTVYDLDVLTTWGVVELTAALQRAEPVFYILTNSRAYSREQAVQMSGEIVRNLEAAARRAERSIEVISRSDSTLRGHYPAELGPLETLYPGGPDGHLIVPAFPPGGRITVDSIHYVVEGERAVPVAETPFARDPSFGYAASSLPAWVEEKTGGRWRAEDALRIPLAALRTGNPERVAEILGDARGNRPIVSDAVSDADLTVLAAGLLLAQERGGRFLVRSGASFVKARAGLEDRPPLCGSALHAVASGPGLVLAGSYVPKTTEQLRRVLDARVTESRELPVMDLLGEHETRAAADLAQWASSVLSSGRTALIYTSRELVATQGGPRAHAYRGFGIAHSLLHRGAAGPSSRLDTGEGRNHIK